MKKSLELKTGDRLVVANKSQKAIGNEADELEKAIFGCNIVVTYGLHLGKLSTVESIQNHRTTYIKVAGIDSSIRRDNLSFLLDTKGQSLKKVVDELQYTLSKLPWNFHNGERDIKFDNSWAKGWDEFVHVKGISDYFKGGGVINQVIISQERVYIGRFNWRDEADLYKDRARVWFNNHFHTWLIQFGNERRWPTEQELRAKLQSEGVRKKLFCIKCCLIIS
jgi:hypothetical protein